MPVFSEVYVKNLHLPGDSMVIQNANWTQWKWHEYRITFQTLCLSCLCSRTLSGRTQYEENVMYKKWAVDREHTEKSMIIARHSPSPWLVRLRNHIHTYLDRAHIHTPYSPVDENAENIYSRHIASYTMSQHFIFQRAYTLILLITDKGVKRAEISPTKRTHSAYT